MESGEKIEFLLRKYVISKHDHLLKTCMGNLIIFSLKVEAYALISNESTKKVAFKCNLLQSTKLSSIEH